MELLAVVELDTLDARFALRPGRLVTYDAGSDAATGAGSRVAGSSSTPGSP